VLIRDDGETWTAITQPAHAFVSGQVAAHWRIPLAPDVILGIQQHDVPWVDQDRMPTLHAPARRAASFIELDMRTRLWIWGTVTERLVAQSPYAALLVSLHSTNIHTRYFPPEARPDELLAKTRADQDALLAVLPDVTREQAERDADIVFALDALSLTLCHGWDSRDLPAIDGEVIRVEPVGDHAATLDPWPLAVDSLEVSVDARVMRERFDEEAAMQDALAAAPNTRLRWTLSPAAAAR
jgi:Protein of unknown function (DUF3891)